MEFKQIQELIKLVNKTDLAELSIEMGDFRIKLRTKEGIAAKSHGDTHNVISQVPIQQPAFTPAQVITQQPVVPPAQDAVKAAAETTPDEDPDKYHTIRSPMVGTFYRSPAPDKDPFVKVGDDIKEGSVLCIIEAMKLFNEIESEISGKIVKVLVEDTSPVEYDQPLYLVEPHS